MMATKISKQTANMIIRQGKRIMDLFATELKLENDSEAKYGFVTSKVEQQTDKLRAQAEKIEQSVIKRLHAAELADEDGLTNDQAGDICEQHPETDRYLLHFSDGSWC